MSLLKSFFKKNRSNDQGTKHKTMADFIKEATEVIDREIARNNLWYVELPYPGAMSMDQAREYEIERLAMKQRIIYDARRSDLPALRWECRGDDKSCTECVELHGRIYFKSEYGDLADMPHHLGCRCELIPVRNP